MMRYHRVSPDYLPVSNGRKPTTTLRTFKEDDPDHRFPNYSSPSSFDPKALRFRSTTSNPSQETHLLHQHPSTDTPTPPAPKSQPHPEIVNGGGDVLLQWGHNKRSRGSRAERRAAAAVEESSGHTRQMVKIQRRGGGLSPAVMSLPPCGSYSRGANLRPCMPSRDAPSTLVSRSVDERSVGLGEHPRSEKRCPRSPPQQKPLKMGSCGATANGCSAAGNSDAKPPSDQETGGGSAQPEKLNLDQFEWPRIYISLSRKEKEDDFLAMKGTKLPQRPKKRAKNVDKTLQYCFPGMWLSDLTRGRYEVREKKCVKKQKRRGLKGMESMESESE